MKNEHERREHQVFFGDVARYAFLLVLILLALLFVGLIFHHEQTLAILDVVKWIAILVGSILALLILVPKLLLFLHAILMRIEEYKTSVQEREKLEGETQVLNAQAEKIQAEKEALILRNQAEVEQIKARTFIEIQTASLFKYGISENVLQITPNGIQQIAEAQQRILPPGKNDAPRYVPASPSFQQMHHLITDENHIVLSYTSEKPVFGTVDKHLLSKLIMGMPGKGKSTALLYDLGVLVKVGAFPIVFDPQGSLGELNGIFPYFDNYDGIYQAIPIIQEEMNERDTLWRKDRKTKSPIVFLIDEIPLISEYEKKHKVVNGVMSLLTHVVLQYRKYRVYGIVTGQSIPATVIPTITRDNMSSRQIYTTKDRQALTVGLDKESREILLPFIEKAGSGVGILDMSAEKEPLVISTPYTEVADIVPLIENDTRYDVWRDKFLVN